MSLSDLASIGSFVSAAAVLVSLVYLSLQVKQAAKNQRAAMVNATSARLGDQMFRLMEPHNEGLYFRMMTSDESYSSAEIVKLISLLTAFTLGIEDSYLLSRQELIDPSMLETNLKLADIVFTLPVPRALWPFMRDSFVPDFIAFLEQRMHSTPLREQIDFEEALKLSLAHVKRVAVATA
jgi:hypothetical protein